MTVMSYAAASQQGAGFQGGHLGLHSHRDVTLCHDCMCVCVCVMSLRSSQPESFTFLLCLTNVCVSKFTGVCV